MRDPVIIALDDGPLTAAEVAKAIGLPVDAAELSLRILLGQLRVARVGETRWRALPAGAVLSNVARSLSGIEAALAGKAARLRALVEF
jgi:hypothetical protein